MRYMKVKWLGETPKDDEIMGHLEKGLGLRGITLAKVKIKNGVIHSSNAWTLKVRGALSLKWQFTARVSSTKKGLVN